MMIDITSSTWKEICDWADTRRAEHLAALCKPMIDSRHADMLRGRIAELDLILVLGRPARKIESKIVSYGV